MTWLGRDRLLRRSARFAFHVSAWLILAPLLFVVWVAFFSNKIVSFPAEGYTLAWFANAWSQASFRDGFLLSVQVALLAAAGALVLGIPAGLVIARYSFPGKAILNGLLMSPLIVPAIVAGTAIYMFYIEIELMTEVQIAATLVGLVSAHTVIAVPWTLRLVIASLVGVDRSIEEAAMNLGADRWTTFVKVMLPVIRPAIVAAALFSFVISFIDLEMSLFLVGPGRTTLPIAIVSYLQWTLDPTICAVACLQITTIGTALLLADRFVRISKVF